MTELSPVKDPPASRWGAFRHLGPGLIITASIVGSGELIMTPKLGAEAGFSLLWFVILGCVLKVFVQIELGRVAVSKGMTTLEILDSVPGPRLRVSWLLWLWLGMYVAVLFQVGGIVGALGHVFAAAGTPLEARVLGLVVSVVCAMLLVVGWYRFLERFCIAQVVLFTVSTIVGLAALQRTDFALSWAEIGQGLRFSLPEDFTVAFACFGIIGVGATELIYYPYWCLEKGYAKFAGPADGSPGWAGRARGWLRVMAVDGWTSMVVYTLATVAFYLLGAAVLSGKGMQVTNRELIGTLSEMYRAAFGPAGYYLFLVGAFFVLFSTLFSATAGKARLLADAASLFGAVRYRDEAHRRRFIKGACAALPLVSAGIYFFWQEPVYLVTIGGVAQAVMLPFLASTALYYRYRRVDPELRPGRAWSAFLWLASLALAAGAVYEVADRLRKAL